MFRALDTTIELILEHVTVWSVWLSPRVFSSIPAMKWYVAFRNCSFILYHILFYDLDWKVDGWSRLGVYFKEIRAYLGIKGNDWVVNDWVGYGSVPIVKHCFSRNSIIKLFALRCIEEKEGRFNYVTPTSFLELLSEIQIFGIVDWLIDRYSC